MFKDLPSSKCQVSVERIVLDLDIRGCLGSIPTGGNILSLDFLVSCNKDEKAFSYSL